MVCPAAVNADPIAEPLPPAGFTEEAFVTGLVASLGPELAVEVHEWLMAKWRPWAREGWKRAERAHDWCGEQAKPAGP